MKSSVAVCWCASSKVAGNHQTSASASYVPAGTSGMKWGPTLVPMPPKPSWVMKIALDAASQESTMLNATPWPTRT